MTADTDHQIERRRHARRATDRPVARDAAAAPFRRASDPDPECTPETALQLLVEETAASEASLRDVAQTLSHELRTPLTTIYSGSKLLARHSSGLTAAMVHEVSSAMAADAERLLRIVEDLVVAVALPGEPAIHGEPVLVHRLLPAVARAAEARWPMITVDVVADEHLPAVRADEVHLEQVLRNILDNAAQYGPHPGRIRLCAERAGDAVEIHVLDRGPGIPPDHAERVFRLFERSGTPHRQGGLGLGLFVSRRLVELMGGHLWVAPRNGGGSDFGFDLAVYPVDDH